MPVRSGRDKEGCYVKWGERGAKYYYRCNSDKEKAEAVKKALAQATASGEFENNP